jgi:hypothetical protein
VVINSSSFAISSLNSEAITGQPDPRQDRHDQQAAPDDRATEFKAVEGGGETRSGATLMVEAYALIWLILMAWIYMLWRKQASLHARLDDLEKVIDKAAAASKPTK